MSQIKYLAVEIPDFCETPCEEFRIQEDILFRDGKVWIQNYSCQHENTCRRLRNEIERVKKNNAED